jgi:hypothetical protein
VKGSYAKARLWSCGDVRLAFGVKLHTVGLHEGPMDRYVRFQLGSEGAASAKGEFRMILCRSQPEGRGSVTEWYQSMILSIYFRHRELEEKE